MKGLFRKGIFALLLSVIMLTLMPNMAYTGGDDSLVLEKSYKWITGSYSYAMGVASADIDNDGVTEIITIGYYYNSTATPQVNEGELDIWTWNGADLLLEHAEYYEAGYTWSSDTRLYDVAVGNLDNDTDMEIVAVGFSKFLTVEELGLLLVGSWNGSAFNRKAVTYWPFEGEMRETKAFGAALGDIDRDNVTEIVVVGYENATKVGIGFHGQITIWNMTGNDLLLEASEEWRTTGDAVWRSVAIGDVDLDGEDEILIAGDFYDSILNVRCAVLRICSWDGKDLEWEASRQWYTYLDTYCQAIAVGNLDSDGIPDIVTFGYQMDSERLYSQLRIWNWKDELLTLRLSIEGGAVTAFSGNLGTAIAIDDVDGDGINEIIVGIQILAMFYSTAMLKVFSWNGQTLTVEGSEDWTDTSVIEEITCSDVDGDDSTEIIAVGYATGMMISPSSNIGIWSVSKVKSRISLKLSSTEITIGDQVVISGQIVNETGNTPISNVGVKIEFEYESEGLQPLTTVKTNEKGEFSYAWIPPKPGRYTIRASWNGDFQHEGASETTLLMVKKAPSIIALALSDYTAKVGEKISINGTLYPAQETSLMLEYTFPNGTIMAKAVDSNSEGRFSDAILVDQVGEWKIRASWDGNEIYNGTESLPLTLTVTKKSSQISIEASALTVKVGENITISGSLKPGQKATITLTCIGPNGTALTETIETASTGAFNYTIRLDQAGVWRIIASWSGNKEYEAATSVPVTITAYTADQITQMLTMAGLALGTIALIIAAAAIYMASRKKKPTPQPQMQTQPQPPQ